MLKANRLITLVCIFTTMTMFLVGCSNPLSKNDNTTQYEVNTNGGFSKDKKTYTLSSNDVATNETITIKIPEHINIVLEDNNESDNSYISLYNVKENQVASKDDYILTYSLVNEDEIIYDREDVSNLYKSLYKNLQVSDIQNGEHNETPYKYYTISYTSDDETLVDYVFEFQIKGSCLLVKMGTTFYPLNMDFDTILKTIFENIN